MAATATFLTTAITKLELSNECAQLGTATGFFIRSNEQWYLVTNWHVFSGRKPDTGQPRHPSGAVPSFCDYYATALLNDKLVWKKYTLELGSEADDSIAWYEHPVHGQLVDVAVIRIENVCEPARDILDSGGHDPMMFIDLGADLFLPGFPLGLSANGLMPIWKRASLASSLEFGHSMTTFFFVDTATREGMSGSPCFAISNWRHYSLTGEGAKMKIIDNPMSWRFLGVYSGRFNPSDNFEAQIGKVWRENLVFEIISSKKKGSFTLK
ncbi:MAG: hypothetical protein B0W54_23420 [Cellvibrio sp. 79]|nr:MAG: hypothetical protein B0W54_23420 [Cellvibrio sp. 79]